MADHRLGQQAGRRHSHGLGVGHMLVPHQEGLFGRLHQGMDARHVVGVPALLANAVVHPQDQQRRQALRGRCHVVERGVGDFQSQWRLDLRLVARQVFGRDGAAHVCQVLGNLARHLAPVKIVGSSACELFQGGCQSRKCVPVTVLGHLALRCQKGLGKTRLMGQLTQLVAGVDFLAVGDRKTCPRIVDGAFQQTRKRQASTPMLLAVSIGRAPA